MAVQRAHDLARRRAPAPPAVTGPVGGAWLALVVILLAGLAFLLYAPVLPPEPILDDAAVALRNDAVHSGSPPCMLAPFYGDAYRPLWRPLATASLRANWLLAVDSQPPERPRVRAAAHRAMLWTQVALFAALGAVACLWVRRLGLSLAAAAVAAALLLLHPVNAESVWRIAGRSELLGHLFLLLAFLIYGAWLAPPGERGARALRGGGRRVLAWVGFGLCALASLFSRETALLLPVFLIGYELTVGRRDPAVAAGSGEEMEGVAGRRVPLVALGICVGLGVLWMGLRTGVLAGLPDEFRLSPVFDYTQALEPGERVRLALALPWLYLRVLLLAGPLLPDYTHLVARPASAPAVTLGDPSSFGVRAPGGGEVILGVAVIVLAAGLVFLLRRRVPRAALGAWIFGASLLAVLPLLGPHGTVASLRHLFLPLLGLLLMIGALVEDGLSGLWARSRAGWLQGGILGVLAVLVLVVGWGVGQKARAYTLHWTDPASYLDRLRGEAPNSPVPGAVLGGLALHRGETEAAAGFYEETIGHFPRNPHALLNLALIRADQGQHSVAGRVFHDAAVVAGRFYPGTRLQSNSHLAMATLLGLQGIEEGRIEQLQLAVAADSTNAKALGQLGMMLALTYSTAEEGVRLMSRSLELDRELQRSGKPSSLGRQVEEIRRVRSRTARNLGLPADQWGDEDPEAAEAEANRSAPVEPSRGPE